MLFLILISQPRQTFHCFFTEMFFSDSNLFGKISVISFNFCAILLRLFVQYILKTIWKYWHWQFGISINTAKFYFSLTKTFRKIKHYQCNYCVIYLAPVSLCYKFSFIYDLLFIHPEATIGALEKVLFEFLEYSSISITKKYLKLKFCETSQKNIYFGVPYWRKFAYVLGVQKTTRLKRFISVLGVRKKACLRNVRRGQRCAHVITCFMWQSLNYLYSPIIVYTFESEIYGLLNEKWQIYKGPIRKTNELKKLIASIFVFTLVFLCLIRNLSIIFHYRYFHCEWMIPEFRW